MTAKIVAEGIPRIHPSTKTVNIFPKSIRINFIRAQESNQKFTATMQILNQEIIARPLSLSETA